MVKLPRTHPHLSCTPSFPFITVVRGGSVWSNYPELTRTFPIRLLFPSSQWFGVVKLPRTHSNLSCTPSVPFITVVRGGSVWSNYPNSLAPFLYAFFSLQIRQRPGIRDLLTCVHTRVYVEERPYHHYYGSHSLDTVYTS